MKPFTKEQFEAFKNWIRMEITSPQSMECAHLIHYARALLVNDSEPEKVEGLLGAMGIHQGEQVVQDFLGSKYFKSETEKPLTATENEKNNENYMTQFNNSISACYGLHYSKDDLPAHDGKPVYTYNPETHIVMPRVWSEEHKKLINVLLCNRYVERDGSSTNSEDIHYAITKVFGGEK